MEITNIRRLSFEELCSIHENCIQRDFPKNEVRPLSMVKRLAKKGLYIAYGAYNNNKLIAYATFFNLPNNPVVLLDYLAVQPQHRGTGIGSSFLREFKGIVKAEFKHAQIIAIECENPEFSTTKQEKLIREKRISFYKQNGASLTNSKLYAFGVNYNLLALQLEKSNTGLQLGKSVYDLYLYGFSFLLKPLAKNYLKHFDDTKLI